MTTNADEKFWTNRYGKVKDIRVVGFLQKTPAQNEKEYAEAAKLFRSYVNADLPPAQRGSVLEIGYGLGHYSRLCKELGFRSYTGIDFAAPPGPDLGPTYTYQKGDAGVPFDLKRKFDLVMAIDVLFHITDEARFEQALQNLKRHAAKVIYVTGRVKAQRIAAHVLHRDGKRFAKLGKLIAVSRWRDTAMSRYRVAT